MRSYGKSVYLGLGSNLHGLWGGPQDCLERAVAVLEEKNMEIGPVSRLYESPALGSGLQQSFLNRVLAVRTDLSPAGLVRELKSIERAAGRTQGARWGARPLDIDILDYSGRVLNWKRGGRTGRASGLILPHPEMERRAFVLKPLDEIAPNWRHPVFDATASQLLAALEPRRRNSARLMRIVTTIT